jgi:gliding motility-associated-like protein
VEIADTGYYRCFVSSACGNAYSVPVQLNVNHIVATIGTPAPFLINTATTVINVGVNVTDRLLYWDMGFALVAPDGTEVMLKAPGSFCVVPPYNNAVDAVFTTEIDKSSGDTINWCLSTKLISGTFAATGDWSVLNGMDPSNGAWQVRVYDSFNASSIFDGYLKEATLSFTDKDIDGDTVTVHYNSGIINEQILNPIAGELRATSYVVPISLMTSCFDSEDARAVVTVQGGVAPFTYQWTGPTSVPASASVTLGPGTYSVLVTDALGCSATATVDVTAPPAIVFDDLQHTDSLACFGSSDGVIRSKATGGTGTLTYTLLPGNIPSAVADSGVFLNLTAGDYTIRVTDINDCSFDTVIHIYQRPELQVQVNIVPVIGLNPGSINITASGGTPPYQYSIDNGTTLQDSGQFINLAAGIYQVYVVDANGCIYTEDVNLNITPLDVTVTSHDVTCFGLADGSFFLAATNGVGPYTLTASWLSAPQVEPAGLFAYTGQTAGLYDIRIEDSQGWLFIDTVEILEPIAILATGAVTGATCSALTYDGAIDITVTGGSGVFNFNWSNGASTEDLVNIEAGPYSVVISDENGCASDIFDFDVPGLNVATAYAGEDDIICPGAEYQLIGSVGDSVRWEPAQLLDNPEITNPTATVDDRTSFIYTVYDNGCMDRDTVVIDTYERIGMDIYDPSGTVNIDTTLYLLEGESFTMAATPGFESYLWTPATYLSDPTLQAVVVTPDDNIYYTVFGTTDQGCVESDRVHVVIARPIEIYSGFSPNGDGTNDTWIITNAIQYGTRIRIQVFNRWGEIVFETNGYGANQEWDGNRNGRPLPVGAYYYIIEVNDGKSKPYTGTVTILR